MNLFEIIARLRKMISAGMARYHVTGRVVRCPWYAGRYLGTAASTKVLAAVDMAPHRGRI